MALAYFAVNNALLLVTMRAESLLTDYDSTNVRFMNASFSRVFLADIHQCI